MRMESTKPCKGCKLTKPVAEFVTLDGVANPRGHYCRYCYVERRHEERMAALRGEAAAIPKLKILFGESWSHYAWPSAFAVTLYNERTTCPYCHRPLPPAYVRREQLGADRSARAHLDHMDPLVRGGEDSIRNALYICDQCNARKGDMLFTEWLALLDPEARELCRAIYATKHGHSPEDFSPGDAAPRLGGGAAYELMLTEDELREMYPKPMVDGPPSQAPVEVEIKVSDFMQQPGIREMLAKATESMKRSGATKRTRRKARGA